MSTLIDKLTANGTIRGVVRIVFAHIGSAIVSVLKFVFIDVTDAIWGGLYRWLDSIRPRILVFLFIPLVIGLAAVVIVDYSDKYLTTDIYCGKACHVMEHPYKELKKSKHWNMRSGVRTTCADCHVSGRLSFAMWDHIIDFTELWVWYTTDFSEKETFDWMRPSLAEKVRLEMLEDDSANCRRCHIEEAIDPEKKRGQKEHKEALEEGTTCIVCHYNLVHQKVEPSKRFLKRIDEIDVLNVKKGKTARRKKEAEKGALIEKLGEPDAKQAQGRRDASTDSPSRGRKRSAPNRRPSESTPPSPAGRPGLRVPLP